MSVSLWISTAYLQQSPSTDKFAALLAFADSRETFEQLVKTTSESRNLFSTTWANVACVSS